MSLFFYQIENSNQLMEKFKYLLNLEQYTKRYGALCYFSKDIHILLLIDQIYQRKNIKHKKRKIERKSN